MLCACSGVNLCMNMSSNFHIHHVGALVKELHLQNVGISDSDCSNIAELLEKNSALEVLNLRGSDMSSAGLSQLTPSVLKVLTHAVLQIICTWCEMY